MADAPAPDKPFPSGSWDTPENPALKQQQANWNTLQPSVGYGPAPRAIQTTAASVGVPQGGVVARPRPQGIPMLQRLRMAFAEMQKGAPK
jgi:hypothetical protein